MPSHYHMSTILSDRHFSSLKAMLANQRERVRFTAYALRIKYGKQFKNMAKAKASKKGLCINVEKAKKCPQTAVSVVPLPVIDPIQSPVRPPGLKRRPSSLSVPIPTSSSRPRKMQTRPRPTSTPSASSALSPLSSSLQLRTLPDINSHGKPARQTHAVLPRLDIPAIPAISVSYFSAMSIEDRVPMDVLSASGDDLYAPAAPAGIVKELPEVMSNAVCWFDVDLSFDSPSSSSGSSSLGPETPHDSEDESAVKIRIKKRKMSEDEGEELQHPKQIMKKRWSALSNLSDACVNRADLH